MLLRKVEYLQRREDQLEEALRKSNGWRTTLFSVGLFLGLNFPPSTAWWTLAVLTILKIVAMFVMYLGLM